MLRRRFTRPFAVVFFAVPAIAACGGHVISLGNSDLLNKVSAAQVTASGGSCPSGWVHPNICCSGSSDSSCGEWASNPLRACDPGDTTYPDPLSCCPLSDPDPSKCIDTPADAGPVPSPPPSFGCGYACPPGWWSQGASITPGGPEDPSCCTVQGTTTICEPQAGVVPIDYAPPTTCAVPGTGSVDASVEDAGPAPIADGGPLPPVGAVPDAGAPSDGGSPALDGGSPEDASPDGPVDDDGGYPSDDGGSCTSPGADAGYPGYDGGGASLCAACPAGWSPLPSQPEVCCTTTPSGVGECFSQATGSAFGIGVASVDAGATTAADAGPSTSQTNGVTSSPGWGGSGPGGETCSGSDGVCSCEQTTGGHTYAIDCYAASDGTIACSCSIDGTSSGTTAIAACTQAAVSSAFVATSGCGF